MFKRENILIFFFNFFILLLFNFAHPVTPAMLEIKDAPSYTYGFSMGAMSLGALLASPYMGKYIDMIGTKKMLPIAMVGYAITQAIFALSYSVPLMLLARVFSGVFSVIWLIGASSYLNLANPGKKKANIFAGIAITTALGGIVGQLLSGAIGETNYIYSFIVQVFGLFFFTIVSYFVLTDFKPEEIRRNQRTSVINTVRELTKHRLFLFMLVITGFATVMSILDSTLGQFANDELNFKSNQISYLSAYVNTINLTANFIFVGLIDRYLHQKKKFVFLYSLMIVGFLMFLITTYFNLPIYIYLIALIFIVIATGTYNPLTQKYILEKNIATSGVALGYITVFLYIGRVTGNFMTGILYSFNHMLPFYFMGLIIILGSIILIMIIKRERNE